MRTLIAVLFIGLGLSSCSKDFDCNDSTLSSAIVGEWSVRYFGVGIGRMDFKADGTLEENAGLLFSIQFGDVEYDRKYYEVLSETQVYIRAESETDTVDFEFDVLSFDCERMEIEVDGNSAALVRKSL